MIDALLGVALAAMFVSLAASLVAVRVLRRVERLAEQAEQPLYVTEERSPMTMEEVMRAAQKTAVSPLRGLRLSPLWPPE
jgi:hypothetical protein